MIYSSIDDMPQAVWRKIGKATTEKEALVLMFAVPEKVTKRKRPLLQERLQAIKDQYFEEILLDDDLELKILKHIDLEILRTELLIKNDNYKMTLFLKLEMELAAKQQNIDNSDKKYYKNKVVLDKYMQFRIDENIVSVREFDSMFKMMVQEYDAIQAQRLQQNKIS